MLRSSIYYKYVNQLFIYYFPIYFDKVLIFILQHVFEIMKTFNSIVCNRIFTMIRNLIRYTRSHAGGDFAHVFVRKYSMDQIMLSGIRKKCMVRFTKESCTIFKCRQINNKTRLWHVQVHLTLNLKLGLLEVYAVKLY